jgi:arginine-tRNA-protein transferase
VSPAKHGNPKFWRLWLILIINREKARQRKEFDLLSTIHESEYEHLKKPPEPEHRFEVTLEPDDFTQEKYKLFENYQTHVHNEPPPQTTCGGFRRFLCDSPLQRISRQLPSGVQQQLGSFHHCYRLNGRLIAMSVLDLLPHCVSGVYFIYHQDFEKWSFGKLSALREIALAMESEYDYYYMGYYIHSCAKMKYKNDYRPQHVLDLETFGWDPLDDEVKTAMDELKYVSVSRLRESHNTSLEPVVDEGTKVDEIEQTNSIVRRKTFDSPIEACIAVDDGLSLFELDFPGMIPAQDVEKQIDLDLVQLRLEGGQVVLCDVSSPLLE